MQNKWTSDHKSTKTYKIGKVSGFGVSYLLFASVLFILLSYLHRIPELVQYWQVVVVVAGSYALGLLTMGRKKWDI